MIYTPKVNLAIKLMYEKHKDQVDKQGIPYVFHPFIVANNMETEEETIVALLHDVIEDTNTSIEDLKKFGFNDKIINAIDTLTHKENEDYETYIARIATNKLATKVKMADLRHNMDITRFANTIISDNYLRKYKIYDQSLQYLENIEYQDNNERTR